MGKVMRNIFLLISVFMLNSCSDMNNDTPYDSTRDVIFTVDMQQVIQDNIFDIEVDTLELIIDSNNTYNICLLYTSPSPRDRG